MKRITALAVIIYATFGFLSPATANAGDLTLSLGEIPGQCQRDDQGKLTGGYGKLALLLQQAYTGGSLTITGPVSLEASLERVTSEMMISDT